MVASRSQTALLVAQLLLVPILTVGAFLTLEHLTRDSPLPEGSTCCRTFSRDNVMNFMFIGMLRGRDWNCHLRFELHLRQIPTHQVDAAVNRAARPFFGLAALDSSKDTGEAPACLTKHKFI
jgi:hypothetical protein